MQSQGIRYVATDASTGAVRGRWVAPPDAGHGASQLPGRMPAAGSRSAEGRGGPMCRWWWGV